MGVSVIIPVYNRCSELRRALDSVYAQTIPADEVIVVDDGSDVDTGQLIRNRFPQTRFIRQAHAGVSRARNHGIEHARGEWIAFLDSDDIWHPDKLRAQLNRLQRTDGEICHTDEIWVRNGVRVNPHNKHRKSGGDLFSRCLALCLISPSSVMISRTLLKNVGGFDESLPVCEDYDLWLRISSLQTIEYIDRPLITKYGGHSDQLSQKYWGMDRFRIRSMQKLYRENRLTDEQAVELLNEIIKKCTIFACGAKKRNHDDNYRKYSEKVLHFQRELDELMS